MWTKYDIVLKWEVYMSLMVVFILCLLMNVTAILCLVGRWAVSGGFCFLLCGGCVEC